MDRQPHKHFHTTLVAISILVLAIWSERASGGDYEGHNLLKPLPENMHEVILTTVDGVQIAGNYYTNSHKRLVIVLNGLFMTKDSDFKYNFCEILNKRYDVINIDFRGHGRSGGEFTGGIKEAFDLQAAVQFARDRGYEKIGLVGFSFGGYMTIKGAALIPDIKSIVTISAPYNIDRDNPKNYDQKAFNLAVKFGKFLLERIIGVKYIDDLPKEAVALKPYLENLKQPILICHGDWDTLVPFSDGQNIFNLAKSNKRFLTLEKGSHAETLSGYHVEKVLEEIFKWFEATL